MKYGNYQLIKEVLNVPMYVEAKGRISTPIKKKRKKKLILSFQEISIQDKLLILFRLEKKGENVLSCL